MLLRFENPKIWLAECIFDHTKQEISKPTFTFLEFLSASQIVDSAIFFLSYGRFKNSAIWLAEGIITQEPEFYQVKNSCKHEANSMKFYLRPNPEEVMKPLKILKKPLVLAISASFCIFLRKKWIFSKNCTLLVFRFYNYLPSCKNFQETIISGYWEKLWTKKQTDRHTTFYTLH